MKSPILLVLSVFVVLSCNKQEEPSATSCFFPDQTDNTTHDIFSKWELIGFVNPDGEEVCKPERAGYCELNIDGSPNPGLRTSCNGGQANGFSVTADSIYFGQIWTTLAYCHDMMDVEGRFFQGVYHAVLYKIDRDVLTLKTDEGDVLKFRMVK